MAKSNVSEWDVVADNNITINGININENCPPSAINNAIREMMAQIKMWKDGYTDPISGLPVYQSLTVQNIDVKGTIDIDGVIKLNGSAGTDGQVLTSKCTSTTPVWADLGLGTMAYQNNTSVNIDGGTITGTTINGNVVGSNSTGKKTISTGNPSGGSNGDIWYKYI